jgi:peptide/nickel transport system ATP-binding protein
MTPVPPARPPVAPLLAVEDLHVRFPGPGGAVEAVRGVSFTLKREKLGIVGESGSGKSTLGRAILRLVPPPGEARAKRLELLGTELSDLSEEEMRERRGRHVSMILQDPGFSLNPVMTVGAQIAEAWQTHTGHSWKKSRRRVLAMLQAVRIRDPERVFDAYAHELSGGMSQRAMIAMMLITEPDLLIADEPTSALDVTVQTQVLAILDELVSRRGMGLIFISHDLGLVASFCDRVLVMYGGRIVESCPAAELDNATHPYTRGLLAAQPTLERAGGRLPVMERDPAWLAEADTGPGR